MPDSVPPGWWTISLGERNAVRHAGLVSGMAILQEGNCLDLDCCRKRQSFRHVEAKERGSASVMSG